MVRRIAGENWHLEIGAKNGDEKWCLEMAMTKSHEKLRWGMVRRGKDKKLQRQIETRNVDVW